MSCRCTDQVRSRCLSAALHGTEGVRSVWMKKMPVSGCGVILSLGSLTNNSTLCTRLGTLGSPFRVVTCIPRSQLIFASRETYPSSLGVSRGEIVPVVHAKVPPHCGDLTSREDSLVKTRPAVCCTIIEDKRSQCGFHFRLTGRLMSSEGALMRWIERCPCTFEGLSTGEPTTPTKKRTSPRGHACLATISSRTARGRTSSDFATAAAVLVVPVALDRRPSFIRRSFIGRLCGKLCEFGFYRGPVLCNPGGKLCGFGFCGRPSFTNINRHCDCCGGCRDPVLCNSRRPRFSSRLYGCCSSGTVHVICSGPRGLRFTRGHLCRGPVLCNPKRPSFTNINRLCLPLWLWWLWWLWCGPHFSGGTPGVRLRASTSRWTEAEKCPTRSTSSETLRRLTHERVSTVEPS